MAPLLSLLSSIVLVVAAAQASPIELDARQTPGVIEVPVSQVISTNATTTKMVRADRSRVDGFKAATFGQAAAAGQTTVSVRNDMCVAKTIARRGLADS